MHVDFALAARIESVIAFQNSLWANSAALLRPNQGFATAAIAGGHAVYSGPLFPTTKATGIGVSKPITEAELDALEMFFRSRNVKPRIEVCPHAQEPLHRLLRARGYRLDAFVNTHVREVFPSDADEPIPADRRITRVTPANIDAFADTISRGFSEGAPPDPEFLDLPRASALAKGVACFLAFADDLPAGAGGIAITKSDPAFPSHYRPLAALFGASTLPQFRRRGVQTALLSARLAHAASAGCDLAVIHARPGTPSERNIARAGFRLAYTKAVMSLDG
jgi:GNAT superfamily N-acetyltransferase